ncbi:MAG: hypothetical protein M5U26_02835 [Planctomycetota bacterium]|nr:hypothetical protein [Planctomycetota bacterium]
MSAAARRLRAPLAAALLLAPLAHSALHAGEAGEKPPWRLANTQAGFAIRVPARFKSHTPGAKNRVLRTPLAALTLDPPDLLAPSEFVADYDPRLPGRPPPYLAVLAVPFPGALRAEDLETYRARLQEYAVRHKLQQTPPVLEILERAGEAALRIELEDRRAPETVVRVVSYLLVMQGRLYEIRLEHPPEKNGSGRARASTRLCLAGALRTRGP